LAINVAGFAEAVIESGHKTRVGIARPAANDADDRKRGLLSARG
jgi:hypothetical protein